MASFGRDDRNDVNAGRLVTDDRRGDGRRSSRPTVFDEGRDEESAEHRGGNGRTDTATGVKMNARCTLIAQFVQFPDGAFSQLLTTRASCRR